MMPPLRRLPLSVALLAVAILGIPAGFSGNAQEPPPPRPPHVALPLPGTKWSVALEYAKYAATPPSANQDADTPAPPAGVPVRLEMFIGQNGLCRGVITSYDKHQREFFVAKKKILMKCSNSEKVAAIPSADQNPEDFFSLIRDSFPGTGWIFGENYSGMEKLNGRNCYKYHVAPHGKNLPFVPDPETPMNITLDAWIDVETHYPVRIQIGGLTYNFSAVSPYPQNVEFPANYLPYLKKLHVGR